MQEASAGRPSRIRVWDLPTRAAHWTLAAAFGFSWWSAENDHLDWHRWSGYVVLTLLLFRLYWGIVGGTSARFASFVRGPRAVAAYARHLFERAGPVTPGHNPMGGWSVLILLGLLAAVTVLGLFAVDVDGFETGPLAGGIDFDTGRAIAAWHAKIFDVLLGFVVLHLAAILFYRLYRCEDLVTPMIDGSKRVPNGESLPGLRFTPLWASLPGLALAAAAVAWIAHGMTL